LRSWTAALSSWTTSKSEPENDVRLRLGIGVAEVGPTSRLRSARGPRCSSSRFAIGLASARYPETGATARPLGTTTSSEPRTTARSCLASGSGRERAGVDAPSRPGSAVFGRPGRATVSSLFRSRGPRGPERGSDCPRQERCSRGAGVGGFVGQVRDETPERVSVADAVPEGVP
jgi:hypothetical protein